MTNRNPIKAEIKTMKSIRHNTRAQAWAYLGKFDIVHVRRMEKLGLVKTDVCGVGPESPGFRWHVQLTDAGRAFLAA